MFKTLLLLVLAYLAIVEGASSHDENYSYAVSQAKILHIQKKCKEVGNRVIDEDSKLNAAAKDFVKNLLVSADLLNKAISLADPADNIYINSLSEGVAEIKKTASTLQSVQNDTATKVSKQFKTLLLNDCPRVIKPITKALKTNHKRTEKHTFANLVVITSTDNLIYTVEQLNVQILLASKITTVEDLTLATIVTTTTALEKVTSSDNKVKENLLFNIRKLEELTEKGASQLATWLQNRPTTEVQKVHDALIRLNSDLHSSSEGNKDTTDLKDIIARSTRTYLTELKGLSTYQGDKKDDLVEVIVEGITNINVIIVNLEILGKIGGANVLKLVLYVKEVEAAISLEDTFLSLAA